MSANDSNLSSTGFDYVVAVTQDSINGALEEYLYQGQPEVVLCYVYDQSNNPTPIDYSTLVANAKNTDPFSVPDGTAGSDPRVQNLNDASFAFAIKARLGLSPGVPPAQLPPIVGLKPGQSSVTYTLMFAEFVATEILYGPRGSMSWVNKSQPSGQPWTFQTVVDLNFTDADFTALPMAAQNQLKGLQDQGQTFSAQQLYYDLNNAALESVPTFADIPLNSSVNSFMQGDFISTYWATLQASAKAGQSGGVLGLGVKQTSKASASSLTVTDLNFFTPEASGTQNAPLTLNYLCALNGTTLPPTTSAGFNWNWIDPSEVSKYDGVAALNRNALARYLNSRLLQYASLNCYQTAVHVTLEDDPTNANFQWQMIRGQAPTTTYPSSGSTILKYSHASAQAQDQAGIKGAVGEMQLSSTFDMSITVQGNQMIIAQTFVVWCYIRNKVSSASGNLVDKQITDTYTFGVDSAGQLVVSIPSATASPATSVLVDNSQTPSGSSFLNFFADVDDLAADVAQWVQGFTATTLTDIPVSALQSFVFPGGSPFVFADVVFSDNQDLVSHITYADIS